MENRGAIKNYSTFTLRETQDRQTLNFFEQLSFEELVFPFSSSSTRLVCLNIRSKKVFNTTIFTTCGIVVVDTVLGNVWTYCILQD